MAQVGNDVLWHPSLIIKCHRECAPYPGPLLLGIDTTQMLCVKDHLYVAGKSHGSPRDQCRLFEYSLSLDTWDVFDTHLSDFALASYQSDLLLIGGREHERHTLTSKIKSGSHNKMWLLDKQYQLRKADIPPMRTGRLSARALGLGKYLIVVGGDDTGTVEIYDGDAKKWSFGPSLPRFRKESGQQLHVQAIIYHQDANLYVQIRCDTNTSRVFYAPLESIMSWSKSTNVAVSKDKSSFWKEIRCNFYVRSSLMLCRGYLVAIGSAAIHDYRERDIYVYKPSDPYCPWLKVASLPLHLFKYNMKTRIICVLNDHFVLLGDRRSDAGAKVIDTKAFLDADVRLFGDHRSDAGTKSDNTLLLFTFQGKLLSYTCFGLNNVYAHGYHTFTAMDLDLNQRFTLSDLQKVETGANLPIRDKLEPHAYELKEEIDLKEENLIEPKSRRLRDVWLIDRERNRNSVITVTIKDWIGSQQPRKPPTWNNLLLLLQEFKEDEFAHQLELYLKSPPANDLPSDNRWERDG